MELSPRALCTIEEVKIAAEVAGDDGKHDDQLIGLLNATSIELHREAKREFVAINVDASPPPDAQTRIFDLSGRAYTSRVLWLGDLSAPPSAVATRTDPASSAVAITAANYVPLSRVREPWEPITRLRFLDDVSLAPGYLVEVTGVWGFPSIPDDIRQAAANHAAGSFLLDARRRSQVARDADESPDPTRVPRSMIERALKTARGYRRKRGLVSVALVAEHPAAAWPLA